MYGCIHPWCMFPSRPQSSLPPAPLQSSGTLALPRPIVTAAPPWSPGLSWSPSVLVHRTPPRPPPIRPSPRLVGLRNPLWLLPPSVTPWVIITLAGLWGSPVSLVGSCLVCSHLMVSSSASQDCHRPAMDVLWHQWSLCWWVGGNVIFSCCFIIKEF